MPTELPDLDEIRDRIAEIAAEKRATARPYSEIRAEREKRASRPCTARTRERLSEAARQWRKSQALEADDLNPVRKARIEFGGDGLSQKQLAERALVARGVIERAESGRPITSLSAKRLAKALKRSRTELGLL